MKLVRKISISILLIMIALNVSQSYCSASETSSESSWKISQSISKESCEQGDSILLSVYLDNVSNDAEISISQLNCDFEYDTSLFGVSDVTSSSMSLKTGDLENGSFTLSNTNGKSFSKGDLLFQIQLDVKSSSSVGKTTVCVTDVELLGTNSKSISVQNFTPVSITIQKAVEEAGTTDETEFETTIEDIEEDVVIIEGEEKETGSGKTEEAVSAEEKKNTVDTKVSNTVGASTEQKKVDKSYETGAGFGNDIYFLVAGAFAVLAVIAIAARKKIISKLKF